MIVTLTANPCIDKTVFVPTFTVNGVNTVSAVRTDVAGKGINAAVAAKALGCSVRCVAPKHEQGGEALQAFLDAQNMLHDLIPVPGRLRTNMKIFNEQNGDYTELNEKGASLDDFAWKALFRALISAADHAETVALCGSLPPFAPVDFYQKCIWALKEKQVPVILDTSGTPLMHGVAANPDFIKPNIAEFESLCAHPLRTIEEIAREALQFHRKGIRRVCVSMGENGALLAGEDGVWFAPPLSLHIRGVQGAGDSMVAGFCYSMLQKCSPEEMLRNAVAAASASLEREGSLLCTMEGFLEKRREVRVKRLANLKF